MNSIDKNRACRKKMQLLRIMKGNLFTHIPPNSKAPSLMKNSNKWIKKWELYPQTYTKRHQKQDQEIVRLTGNYYLRNE